MLFSFNISVCTVTISFCLLVCTCVCLFTNICFITATLCVPLLPYCSTLCFISSFCKMPILTFVTNLQKLPPGFLEKTARLVSQLTNKAEEVRY